MELLNKTTCICEKCGKEANVDTGVVLTSYPPQYNYYCLHCGHRGYTGMQNKNTNKVEKEKEIMTNKRLYEIIDRLGMIDTDGDKQASDTRTEAEIFEQDVASDLVSTMGFVDQLTTYNDLNTFGKLLVAIISELNKEKENKYSYSRSFKPKYDSSFKPDLDCSKCPNRPEYRYEISDSPCDWCPKRQATCMTSTGICEAFPTERDKNIRIVSGTNDNPCDDCLCSEPGGEECENCPENK